MRPYFLVLLATAFVVLVVVAVVHGIDRWSFTAGIATGGLLSMAIWLRDEPPEFIAKWGRGAEGERKTAKAIAPLLREGWKARHDVDLGRGNADHLLLNPSGVAFLLETKRLAGRITVERGRLTCRFADDPDELAATTCSHASRPSGVRCAINGRAAAGEKHQSSGRS